MLLETISYSALRQNLALVLDQIENDRDVFNVTRKKHSDVVMMSRDDYNSLMETLHLLSSPKNAQRLREALEESDNDEVIEIDL